MEEGKNIDSNFIDVEAASKYLSVSKHLIYQMTSKKSIPHYKLNSKVLFKVSELNDFLEKRRIKTDSEIEAEALKDFISE